MQPSELQMQHHHNGPSSTKAAPQTVKKSGGMVVTKYAPPPGYSNQPAPPRPSSQQQAWPPAPQQYSHARSPSSFSGYPSHSLAAPVAHHQASHSGYYGQGHPQQASPSIGAYPPSANGFHQPSVSPHPSSFEYFDQSPPMDSAVMHGHHSSASDTYGSVTNSYFPPDAHHSRAKSSHGQAHPSSRHSSAPSVAFDYAAAYARQEAGEQMHTYAGASLDNILEVLETEFDDECYYFAHPEEIDKERSIGWIESHTALPTTRPLPATFSEAELEALAPRPQKADECISEYWTAENREEQLNTVRMSNAWAEVKDDLVFKEFLHLGYETIRRDLMKQKYRNRIDSKWDRSNPTASVSHFARASIETTGSFDNEQKRNSRPHTRNGSRSVRRESNDPPNYREHSQGAGGRRGSQAPNYRPSSAASNHSRASSVCSRSSNQRPRALEPIRDQAQDDILAKLGVTGTPTLVYETPGPAFGPPASAHSSRQGSVSSIQDNTPRAPSEPRQQPQNVAFNDPWGNSGKHQHRPNAGLGLYDLTSSEFTIMEDPDATPRPKNNRSHGLKRHYEGDHHETPNREKRIRDNEATPKQGRKQSRAADGYGRRW
ncbi:hypothetical protein Q7P37_007088 [Cladosporium fusiforme]